MVGGRRALEQHGRSFIIHQLKVSDEQIGIAIALPRLRPLPCRVLIGGTGPVLFPADPHPSSIPEPTYKGNYSQVAFLHLRVQ
jgi:hypothetical protein